MDRDILGKLSSEQLDRKELPDLFPERPYKVKVVGSAAEHRFGRVLVDMDRDGKWEERWELRPGEVARIVPEDPASGGTETRYSLAHGRWQPH